MPNLIMNGQFYKFCGYGFFKNLRFFEIFFVLFLKETGISYLNIGILYAIRQITINFLEIPSGLMADTYGRKKALLLSFGSYLISFIIFYFSYSFIYLSVAMVLYGTGEAFRSGTHKAIILDYLKTNNLMDHKTQYYGSTRSCSQFGSALMSLLAAVFLLVGAGYRMLFLFTIIPYLIDLIIIASYPAYLDGKSKQTDQSIFRAFITTLGKFLQLFKSAKSFRAMFSSAAYVAFFKTVKDYLQPILVLMIIQIPFFLEIEEDTRIAIIFGCVFFIIFLMTSFVSRNAWRVEQKIGHLPNAINLLYLVGVGSVILSGTFIYLELNFLAIAVFIIMYLVQNIRRPLIVSYFSELIDSCIMASGLSSASQLETILIIIFAPLIGFLIDTWGVGAGLSAAGILFLILYPFSRLARN